jgi:hypothetical protein
MVLVFGGVDSGDGGDKGPCSDIDGHGIWFGYITIFSNIDVWQSSHWWNSTAWGSHPTKQRRLVNNTASTHKSNLVETTHFNAAFHRVYINKNLSTDPNPSDHLYVQQIHPDPLN